MILSDDQEAGDLVDDAPHCVVRGLQFRSWSTGDHSVIRRSKKELVELEACDTGETSLEALLSRSSGRGHMIEIFLATLQGDWG